MRRFLPGSLRGQVLLVIVAALALAQAVSLWLFADERGLAVRAALTREAMDRAVNVVHLLDESPGNASVILAAANSPLVRFSLDPAPVVSHSGHAPAGVLRELTRELGRDHEVRAEAHEVADVMPPMPGMSPEMMRMHSELRLAAVELRLSVTIGDGRWLNVVTRFHRPPLQWAWRDVATFVLTVVVLFAAVWLLLGRIVGPLRRLSAAADRLGRGEWVEELPVSGPDELARLTVAFNRMQARLRRFVDERSRLLAALGHDLRSPLTALRVRAEMVEDDETRAGLVASVEEMQEMVEATLTYARGTATAEPVAEVDLSDFTARLVAEYAETGREVRLQAPDGTARVRIRPNALRRALRNLIDNALRYGGCARVSLEARPEDWVIHVDDDGPGIAETDMARVFEPYVRLEDSRSRETGGTGLGLAIARTIARAHGGEVTLENRESGGLRASITLPRGGPEIAAADKIKDS